jgi:hypothetical protein
VNIFVQRREKKQLKWRDHTLNPRKILQREQAKMRRKYVTKLSAEAFWMIHGRVPSPTSWQACSEKGQEGGYWKDRS